MWKYVLKRIALALITAFIIISISFLLIKLLPFSKPVGTDNARYAYYMIQVNYGFVVDSIQPLTGYGEPLDVITLDTGGGTHYFYETPVFTQYFVWLKNIITKWDWGVSTYLNPGNPASLIILNDLPVTISINVVSVIVSVPLGIILGIIAALKKNTAVDHTISTSIMIFISIPSFVMITVLMSIFCYNLKWLPTQWPASSAPTGTRVLGYIIPVVCLSFGSICGYARFTRAELCEVMASDYLLLARTKGLTKRQAILRHALRNAMVPIVPSILAEIIGLLGGSMILEQLYGIPGIGKLYVKSLNSKDYNVLFVDMAVFTLIGLLSGVLLDISYGFIDPRIRMGAKK